jgi:hypothetical protein
MGQFYTQGRWVVKEAQQERFQAAWQELAEWTSANVTGALGGEARLLQYLDDPRRLHSFGPWASLRRSRPGELLPAFRSELGAYASSSSRSRPIPFAWSSSAEGKP